jgi:lipoprotein-anchoring transpeptidase ErfK/SrfK
MRPYACVLPVLRRYCLVPAKSSLQNKAGIGGHRGFVLRASISFVVIAFGLAGLIAEAGAQSNPPPDTEFYPEPPAPYPGAPPRPAAGVPMQPPAYGMQPGQQSYGSDGYHDANGVPSEPYFVPRDGESVPRPPVDIGAGDAPADVTGVIRGPAEGAAVPAPSSATMLAALPPDDQPEQGPVKELPSQLRRQLVDYVTAEPAGTIIIDTPHTYLYLVRGNGKALRYGIGVGREGFTWAGNERIKRMTEWPDWHPPKEMIERQPYLPRFMAGGEGNPLGARALYLGSTLYRIHGTNQPSTIGSFVSSGCIRLTNADIEDLYSRVSVGTRVVVLPGSTPTVASGQGTVAR